MNSNLTLLLLILLPLAVIGEWYALRWQFRNRIRDVKGRYVRDRVRTDDALSAAKRQIASLQHQLTGARMEARRAERVVPPPVVTRRAAVPSHSASMILLDDDFHASRPSSNGFADTTVGV